MRRRLAAAVVSLGLLFGTATALAQAPQNYDSDGKPVAWQPLGLQRPYKPWLIIGLLFVLSVVVTFKSSKRSHLD